MKRNKTHYNQFPMRSTLGCLIRFTQWYVLFGLTATILLLFTPWQVALGVNLIVSAIVLGLLGKHLFMVSKKYIVITQIAIKLGTDPVTGLPRLNFYMPPLIGIILGFEKFIGLIPVGFQKDVMRISEDSLELENGRAEMEAEIGFAVNPRQPLKYLNHAISSEARQEIIHAAKEATDGRPGTPAKTLPVYGLTDLPNVTMLVARINTTLSGVTSTMTFNELSDSSSIISECLTSICMGRGVSTSFINSNLGEDTKAKMVMLAPELWRGCLNRGLIAQFEIRKMDFISDTDAAKAKDVLLSEEYISEAIHKIRRSMMTDEEFKKTDVARRVALMKELRLEILSRTGDVSANYHKVEGLESLTHLHIPELKTGATKPKKQAPKKENKPK